MEICKTDGCEKPVRIKLRGLCASHYMTWCRHNNKRLCTLEGCDNKHYGRGYCQKHYRQIVWTPSEVACSVPDCETHVTAKGLCAKHYNRFKTHGSTDMPPKATWAKPRGVCDCGNPSLMVSRNICKACYGREWYNEQQGHSDGMRWIKDEVTYMGMHSRIRALRGLARDHDCQLCGGPAKEWALSANSPVETLRFGTMNNRRGTETAYSLNPDDYFPACVDCHKNYDAKHGNRNYHTGTHSQVAKSRWAA